MGFYYTVSPVPKGGKRGPETEEYRYRRTEISCFFIPDKICLKLPLYMWMFSRK
jgi:hypothetical protein